MNAFICYAAIKIAFAYLRSAFHIQCTSTYAQMQMQIFGIYMPWFPFTNIEMNFIVDNNEHISNICIKKNDKILIL